MHSRKWPAGGGETGELVRTFDWSATPMGPVERWAPSLRTLVELVLVNPVPSALLWGEEGTLVYNDEYARVCGDRHPQVFGAPLQDAWPQAWEFNGRKLADCRAGHPQVIRDAHLVLARDGGMRDCWFDLYYAPVCGSGAAYEGVLATVVETTGRVLAERDRAAQSRELRSLNAALEAQRARMEAAKQRLAGDMRFIKNLFQSSPSFVAVLIGPDHRFELTNAAYDALIQHREAQGKPLRAVLPELAEQGFIALLDRVYRTGEAFHGQDVAVMLGSGGAGAAARRIVDFVYQPLKNAEGRTYGILVEGVDVTARARAEERLRELNDSLERTVSNEVAERLKAEGALRHAQKMEAVGQLASGIAHDFNNVLQIVSSNLQLVERDFAGTTRQRERLAQALSAVSRGSRLSLQLLTFGRKQSLQPAVTQLGLLLDDIAPLLQRALGDGIAMNVEVQAGLWSVHVDRNQFENAILNIAINARDAMQGKGRLQISAHNLAQDGGRRVVLAIADNGCGMSPEVLAKVFDPFYTTKEAGKGTGLGMSMVYGFVRQSEGLIRIDSAVGRGTTILIELPRTDGDHEIDREAAVSCAERGHETILLVEDDPAIRVVTVDILAGLGYRTLTAADGGQALDILKSRAAVDLMFSDVSMPGLVSAAHLVQRAAQLAPEMAVLLTSGHAVDRSLLGDDMPADIALLPKPYALAQLARAVREALDARAREGERQAPAVPAPGQPEVLRFLVVEDEPEARALACEMLEALGCEAQGVASGEQALALLADCAFHVLFTDLHLPGMPGDRLAAQACALRPALQVVLASGEGLAEVKGTACPAMMLPKPYDLLQLQQTIGAIERALGQVRTDASPDPELLSLI